MMMRAPKSQSGVVLIMALLIVVLVTAVVVQVSWRFHLSMARNENRWHGAQARAYLEGGEQLARKILMEDHLEDQQEGVQVDHLNEMWAQQGDALPTDEGWVRGTLEDAHGRFNLNTLVETTQPGAAAEGTDNSRQRVRTDRRDQPLPPAEQYTAPQRRFIRFLQTIELESGPLDQAAALELLAAIIDWIDPDQNVFQGPLGETGVEQSFYESQDPPVYISNTQMTSVSELSQVRGVTPELYKKLKPFVTALPVAPGSGSEFLMNINTMRPELLRAFNLKSELYPLDEGTWTALVEMRKEQTEGIPEIGLFVEALVAQGMGASNADFDTTGLGTTSNYFIYQGETLVGEQVRRNKTLLYRLNGEVAIVRRTDGDF